MNSEQSQEPVSAVRPRKLTSKTIKQKAEIIKFADEHPEMTKRLIADLFGVSRSTLSDILKQKVKILNMAQASHCGTFKRYRPCSLGSVDDALAMWCRQMLDATGVCPGRTEMLEQANKLLRDLEPEREKPVTSSWIDRFKLRHGFAPHKEQESDEPIKPMPRFTDVNLSAPCRDLSAQYWKERKLVDILSRYHPSDIFTVDETVLLWSLLPNKSPEFTEPMVTLMVASNMDGSDKMPLFLVVENSAVQTFRNVHVPVEYSHSSRALMTAEIFESWLRKRDLRLKSEQRKIVIVLDRSPAHTQINLPNIELAFVPKGNPNVTQPMRTGILQNLKLQYRHDLIRRQLEALRDGVQISWTLDDACMALHSAWERVSQQTISVAYERAGFGSRVKLPLDDVIQQGDQTHEHLYTLWETLRQFYGDSLQSLDEYIGADDDIETSENDNHDDLNESQKDVMSALMLKQSDEQNGGENGGHIEPKMAPEVTVSEAREAVRKLRHFGLQNGDGKIADMARQIDELISVHSDATIVDHVIKTESSCGSRHQN